MSFYECYCDDCKSEADEIIEEARDKLVDLITEQANSEINAILENNKRLIKSNEKLRQTIENLENERNNLKTQSDRINGLNNKISPEFQIGETVYYCVPDDRKELLCPICNGAGYVKVNDSAFGTLMADCPKCNVRAQGRRKVGYSTFKIKSGYITSVRITITGVNKEISYEYQITDRESYMYNCFMTKPELHRVKEEAQAVVDKRNAESREKAIKELDGEE